MPKLPVLTPRVVCKALERAGFVLIRQKGSHRMYLKDSFGVTVPYHNKDMKPKTLKHIIQQSGMDLAEFVDFL
jgi:predicted RNA binding protein YcfA (HicA-like mRNA interferase family)